MSDYERIISIAATPPKVFATLTNVTEFAAWWHRPPARLATAASCVSPSKVVLPVKAARRATSAAAGP